jgi:SAM-dependent methyltransferase
MSLSVHWDAVWNSRRPEDVSWYQRDAAVSLRLIERAANPATTVVDVGSGASRLVDALLAKGYTRLTVIDIATAAIDAARLRLGQDAERVTWLVGDATTFDFGRQFDLWHDRALLHFLVDELDRDRYLAALRRAVKVGGAVVIAAFAPDGPSRCSGLPVRRYDRAQMHHVLGDEFEPVEYVDEVHATPAGDSQQFLYGLFQRVGTDAA